MSLTTGVCEWCGKQAAADCCHRREIENLKADVAVFRRDRDWAHERLKKVEESFAEWREGHEMMVRALHLAEQRLAKIDAAAMVIKEMLK